MLEIQWSMKYFTMPISSYNWVWSTLRLTVTSQCGCQSNWSTFQLSSRSTFRSSMIGSPASNFMYSQLMCSFSLAGPGPLGQLFFFDDQPGVATLASILFHWPEWPSGPKLAQLFSFAITPCPFRSLFTCVNDVRRQCLFVRDDVIF